MLKKRQPIIIPAINLQTKLLKPTSIKTFTPLPPSSVSNLSSVQASSSLPIKEYLSMNINESIDIDDPIDIVYTWVNMSDQVWMNKFRMHTGKMPSAVRYQGVDEIKYSIASVKKYASFIRNIYVVTDNQMPPLDFMNDRQIKIIDHSVILGKECAYPTFKSDSIESYLWKIPGLSEVFLYFNDDIFVGNRIEKNMFINNNRKLPIADVKECNFNKFTNSFLEKEPHFRCILTAAKIFSRKFNVPMPRYRNEHFCTVFRKKTCELTWKLFHNELANSVKYNTRDPYEPTVSFQILTHYVGEFYGHMLIRYSQSSPIKMLYGDFNDDIRYNRIKNSLMLMRPHIFCINNLHTPRQKIRFEELMKKYYTGFF